MPEIQPEAIQGKNDPVLADEKVGSGQFGAFANVLRGLPNFVDDITRDFGSDIYERMHNDAYLCGLVNQLKSLTMGEGVAIVPSLDPPVEGAPIDPEYQKRFDRALEVCEFVSTMVAKLKRPLEGAGGVLEEMLDALWCGNKVAELCWKDGRKSFAGKKVLWAIKPKSRRTTAFVVDAFNNLHALFAITPGVTSTLNNAFITPDFLSAAAIIPREKFAVLTFRMRNGDPRGSSIYRSAYTGWRFKQNTWPGYANYIDEYGGGITWMTLPPGRGASPMRDSATGMIARDTAGNARTQTPAMEAAADLQKLKSGQCGVFDDGTAVHIDRPSGKGEAFTPAMDLVNREMTMGVLSTIRAVLESRFGSRADSGTSQDLLGTLVKLIKEWAGEMLEHDVFYKIVLYNFGEDDAEEYTPRALLTGVASEDFAEALSALADAGFKLAKNQFPWASAKVGAPPPDFESGFAETSSEPKDPKEKKQKKGKADDDDESDDDDSGEGKPEPDEDEE